MPIAFAFGNDAFAVLYSRCSHLRSLKRQRTPANCLKRKLRYIPAQFRFIAANFSVAYEQLQINRMKAAITNESGVIDSLLARIAAAKLAQAEANDQSAQLLQSLEAEDAAVMKVRFRFPLHPDSSHAVALTCRCLMTSPQLSFNNKLSKKKFCTRVLG